MEIQVIILRNLLYRIIFLNSQFIIQDSIFMIISFGGEAGSGKSTIAKKLADKLGWPYYYIGGMRRQKAKEKGLTLAEYNKLGETDPSTDLEVDKYQEELGKKEDNFIIEGRTSWYFIPHSLKFYITVKEEEGARRIFKESRENDARNEDKKFQSKEEALKSIRKRQKSDHKRYQKYFGINVFDQGHYDYVIDTTDLNPEEAFQKVWEIVEKRKS